MSVMSFRTSAAALSCALSLFIAAPAAAKSYTDLGSTEVSEGFWIDQIGWERGKGGIEFALAFPPAEDGSLVVCGLIRNLPGKSGLTRQLPGAMQIKVKNKVKVRGLGWLPKISSRDQLVGSQAKCRSYPDVKVSSPNEISLGMGKTKFSN